MTEQDLKNLNQKSEDLEKITDIVSDFESALVEISDPDNSNVVEVKLMFGKSELSIAEQISETLEGLKDRLQKEFDSIQIHKVSGVSQ